MISQTTIRSTVTALVALVVCASQSTSAQTVGVVFTESAGALTETLNGAPIGNWGTATISGGVETWNNTDPLGAGNVIGTYEWPEPPGEPGLFNIVSGGIVMSDAPSSANAETLPLIFTVTDPASQSGEIAVPVSFIDNGDTVTSMPSGTPVPDGSSTLSMLLMAGGALGLAWQRNPGLEVIRSAA
jgi:hypothetical protein